MTKDEILERYLNTVYFGNGAYGVQAAAETYFGVGAGELDLAQSALLAGMIANPTRYDPIRHPEAVHGAPRPRPAPAGRGQAAHGGGRRLARRGRPPHRDQPGAAPARRLLRRGGQAAPARRRAPGGHPRRSATTPSSVAASGSTRPSTPGRSCSPTSRATTCWPRSRPRDARPPPSRSPPTPRRERPRNATGAVVSVEPASGAIRAMVGGAGFADNKFNVTTQGSARAGRRSRCSS